MTTKLVLGAAAAALACSFAAAHAGAAVYTLDFAGAACQPGGVACTDGAAVSQSYGDVGGVVDVSYRSVISPGSGSEAEPSVTYYSTGYGDLNGVAYGSQNATLEVRLAAVAPGTTIRFLSVDYAGSTFYANRVNPIIPTQLNLYDLTLNQLAHTDTAAPGNGRASWMPDVTQSGGLIFHFGPDGYNAAIDNIVFEVNAAVPEPATWAMMIGGFGMIGAATRRRSRATASYA